MDFLEKIPFIPITLFIFGFLFLWGGIRILRHQKVTLIGRDTSLQHWDKSASITGKVSRFWGILYIVGGVSAIGLSAFIYFFGEL